LRAEGVSIIQVDDPHLCLFVDQEIRAGYDNPDQAADFAVDMDNQLVADFTDVRLAVHLCRRAGARARGEAQHQGGYEAIMSQLRRLDVGHITMEFTTPGSGEMSVFRELPEDVEIGLGCVSTLPGQVDSVETIVSRVEQALQHVAPERITLNPECGFAPGSAARVDIDEVYTKLKHEVAAARILREKYG
jgi:5-methyltetrahydropteroyltriglutamate--homocysteine methyltransferase